MFFVDFCAVPTEMVYTHFLKAEYFKKYEPCLSDTFVGIRIIVYSCTGCGTSKMNLRLEGNRSSFSRVSLKSENTDASPQTAVFFQRAKYVFPKTKIWRQTVEDEQIYI